MDISNLQPKVWNNLQTIASGNKIGNAYLFHGPSGAGKEALALKFCSLLTGLKLDQFINHPNIFLIVPGDADFYKKLFKNSKMDQKEYQEWNNFWKEKLIFPLKENKFSNSKRIPIEVLKNLKKDIFFKSQKKKVVIIFDAHALSEGSAESANALLKLLEEPPNNTSFLLITNLTNNIVPTISSRCQMIGIPRISSKYLFDELDKHTNFNVEILSYLSSNNLHKINLLNESSKESILDIIKNYSESIQYMNAEVVSLFADNTLLNFNTKRELFIFELDIIKKWLECNMMINESITVPFIWNDFTDLSKEFLINNPNANILSLLKEVDSCLNNLKYNSSPKLSIMNMIINSHKSLS